MRMKFLSVLFIAMLSVGFVSCGGDDDPDYTYSNITNLAGAFTNGTRSIKAEDRVVTGETNKAYPTNIITMNNQLKVALGYPYPSGQDALDFDDVMFSGFISKDEGATVTYSVSPKNVAVMSGNTLPGFFKTLHPDVKEVKNLKLTSTGGAYNASTKTHTFEYTGTYDYLNESGSSGLNQRISIVYSLKK